VRQVEIVQLLVSPVHRFAGRPGDGVPGLPGEESVTTLSVLEGLGIVGDRYFNRPAHREASVTGFVHVSRLWSTLCGRVRSVTIDLLVALAEMARDSPGRCAA
jgi:hypothetical protein